MWTKSRSIQFFNRDLSLKMLIGLVAAMFMPTTAAVAQEEAQEADSSGLLEEVVVTGTRQIIQDQIAIKRDATMIVDGLSASDIGDLPALSIGEALETITGASSHRENGGATEISIRGLGPFLSATHFNGREATNGSSDRSVNFSMFPSELMSKLAIYKTQNASLIEGGVAGVIELATLRPLDYGKKRFQFDVKGNYNPDQQDISNSIEGDLGYRGTASFVNQVELSGGGQFGFSLGYQNSDTSQPEAEVRGSSPTGTSLYACLNDPRATWEGSYRSSSGDCEDQNADAPWDPDGDGDFSESNQGYQNEINPATGLAYSDGYPFYFAPSSRGYRQNDTSEEREAFFVGLQFQPNDQWDINFDVEISDRLQSEQRHDLNFANMKRTLAGVTGPSLVVAPGGGVLSWTGETAIESNSEVYSRHEEYEGGGLNAVYNVNDGLWVSGDISFSETTRIEKQISLRLQSDNDDIFNEDTPGGYRPDVMWNRDSGIPQFTITDFDVTDPTLFSDEYRARIDSDVDRTNTITSLRLDFGLDVDWGSVNNLQGGIRTSELEYVNLGGTRYTTGNLDDSSEGERATILAINEACRNPVFPESGFLSSEANGPLITVVDEAGNQISGTGNSWATFDTLCVTNMILESQGTAFAYPDQFRAHPATTDVTETTEAAYVMANFESNWGGNPVHGNFGVRVVNTEVESVAYRTEYEILEDGGFLSIQPVPGGALERVSAGDDYTEVLPSFNMVMDLSDEKIFRAGIFRGMSRVDPSDMGYNRSFSLNGSDDITDPDDLVNGVNGSGNPFAQPLMSWNVDTSYEYYPDPDTVLAVGLYYKQFQGGFEQIRSLETFTVDGQAITAPVTVSATSDTKSDLWGVELTASHRWENGLGVKISYNWADSDFEFQDSNYGAVSIRELDGSITPLTTAIIEPGNVPGFSENVFSGQVYYQIGDFDAQVIYKYRSEYFQPYTSNGTRLRYVDDVGVWEARMSYQLNDNIKLSLEAINLGNEPKQTFYYSRDNFGERNVYGPRVFFGIRGKY